MVGGPLVTAGAPPERLQMAQAEALVCWGGPVGISRVLCGVSVQGAGRVTPGRAWQRREPEPASRQRRPCWVGWQLTLQPSRHACACYRCPAGQPGRPEAPAQSR